MTCDRIASLGTWCVIIALLSGCADGGFRLDGYQKSGGEWVYVTWDAGHGRVAHKIKGADSSTFEVLLANEYARDEEHVYFRMHRLDNADPATFVVLSDRVCVYGKDRNRVWLQDVVVREADPATFALLTFPYSRDRSQVFCGTLPMKIHDIESFEVLRGSSTFCTAFVKGKPFAEQYKEVEVTQDNPVTTGEGWARDNRACYYGPFALKDADYDSFTVLNGIYAKDKNCVYWCWLPMPLADARTFRVRDESSGMDKDRTFLGPDPRQMPREVP